MKRTRTYSLFLILLLILTGCSFSFSTANIKDPFMTSSVDSNGKPVDNITSYSPDAPKLIVGAILNNAPDGTKVKFVWYYITENQKITEVTLDSADMSGTYIFSDITYNQPWPIGNYEVQIFVDERDKPDATVTFQVK